MHARLQAEGRGWECRGMILDCEVTGVVAGEPRGSAADRGVATSAGVHPVRRR